MHRSAGRITASVLVSIACLYMVVACRQPPLATPPAVGSVRETGTALPRASTTISPTGSPLRTQTPVPHTPVLKLTLEPAPTAYTAAYTLISAIDLTEYPERYEDVPFSVIGYAYNVHARTDTTTFFLASDEQRSNSIFVVFAGVDRRAQESVPIQVYGTGATTIRVMTNGNVERESPFMHAVMIRSLR